jgi:hypothetical protein
MLREYFNFLMLLKLWKVKQSQDGLWGFEEAEAPRFHDSRHMKVVRSALRTGRLYPPRNIAWGIEDVGAVQRKPKLSLCVSWRQQTYSSSLSSPRHYVEASGSDLGPSRFLHGTGAPGTHWQGSWLGPRVSLGVLNKRKTRCSCWEWNHGLSSP